ncbi:hypothetical protein D5274_01370 [bacterium 1XD42-94]|nr:hypothetical protein [bacterium 1XD42-76]NBK03855.1 hypothetical protein [bacterium 1XD42-94]
MRKRCIKSGFVHPRNGTQDFVNKNRKRQISLLFPVLAYPNMKAGIDIRKKHLFSGHTGQTECRQLKAV